MDPFKQEARRLVSELIDAAHGTVLYEDQSREDEARAALLAHIERGAVPVYCTPTEHEGRIVYEHTSEPIPNADGFVLYAAAPDPAEVPVEWHLDESEAALLHHLTSPDDGEHSPITLRAGAVRMDDGTVKFGLLCEYTDYPDEGATLIAERPILAAAPAPAPAEVPSQHALREKAKPATCDGNHGGPRCADPECWQDPAGAVIDVRTEAERLVKSALAVGVVLTIETQPRQPLAMGHYDVVVETREARKGGAE